MIQAYFHKKKRPQPVEKCFTFHVYKTVIATTEEKARATMCKLLDKAFPNEPHDFELSSTEIVE